MGNDESISLQQNRARFQQMFYKNFILEQERIDEIFGEVSLFKNKNTNKLEIVIKNLTFAEENDMNIIIQGLRERIIHPIPNLLSIYHLENIKVTNAFCGTSLSLKIYFQYLEKSLRQQLKKRRKHKNYFFSEEQLWKIMISLVNAIKHLHQCKIFHGQIRMENVLIDGDYHMKLVQKSLLNRKSWQIQLNKQNIKLIRGKGILFSPCILKCMYHQRTQIVSYDPFKADIFAIGMIMLECCSLNKAEDFYDYDKFTVKLREIQGTIYQMRKKYSFDMMNLIEKMLEQDDDQRLGADDIYDKIKKIPNETIRQLNMTLNESFLNQSIRSYM